jgi:hypothetical protein
MPKRRISGQRLFKSLHPIIPIVPRLVRQFQSAIQKFLYDASDFDPTTDFFLLKKVIINHLAQMILSEEKTHCTSL